MSIYTCIYLHTCIHIYIKILANIYLYICIYTFTFAYIYIFIYTFAYIYIYTCVWQGPLGSISFLCIQACNAIAFLLLWLFNLVISSVSTKVD